MTALTPQVRAVSPSGASNARIMLMVNTAALDQYVQQALAAGQSPSAVKTGLLIMGWPADAVTESLNKLAPGAGLARSESIEPFIAAYPDAHPQTVPILPTVAPVVISTPDVAATVPVGHLNQSKRLILIVAGTIAALVVVGFGGNYVLVASRKKQAKPVVTPPNAAATIGTPAGQQAPNLPTTLPPGTAAPAPVPAVAVVAAGDCFKVNITSAYQVTNNTPCAVSATKASDTLLVSYDPGTYSNLDDFKTATLDQLTSAKVTPESVNAVTVNGQKAYKLTTRTPIPSIIYMFYSAKGYTVDGTVRHGFVVGESGNSLDASVDVVAASFTFK